MSEIQIKNEDNLIENIENIKIELQHSIKNIELIKDLYQKEQQNYFKESYYEDSKLKININLKKRQIKLHITLFIPVLQFLDIKTFLELSKVNRLFYSFFFSFYFYRYVNQILNFSLKRFPKKKLLKNKKEIIPPINISSNRQSQEEENIILGQTKKIYSSFMSAITGAFSYINPTTGITQKTKGEKDELKEIEKKIGLHEKLIDERIKQVKLIKEINDIRQKMEKYINNQNNIKNKKMGNKDKLDDYEIKKMKKEKYEMEYKALTNEINEIESEYYKFKKDNEKQKENGMELDDKINNIKFYVNNSFQINENF